MKHSASEEEQQSVLRLKAAKKAARLEKSGLCCLAGSVAGAVMLPGAVHWLSAAPPLLGLGLIVWAGLLVAFWMLCACACLAAASVLNYKAELRRIKRGRE